MSKFDKAVDVAWIITYNVFRALWAALPYILLILISPFYLAYVVCKIAK